MRYARGSYRSIRSSRFDTLPRLFDIFSPSASTMKPWCIQWLAKRLPRATAWARSFSWCGKRRSWPPQWRSKPSPSRSRAITTHSLCQPGRPSPHGDGHAGSPGFDSFQSAKSAGWCFWSAPKISRSPPPASMSSSDWCASSP